ncbi:MAG TPA: DinB family protein [Phycisphaerales bacterium]|nr:DinB family protein [Phycisphaerales bacterium]
MTSGTIADTIERYKAQADELPAWSAGMSAAQLTAPPSVGAGEWTMHQMIVHVVESDLIASHRMKRIAAEESPLLISYDETAFVRALDYHALELAAACELFRMNRLVTAEVLKRLPEEAFARHGIHNQQGKVTLLHVVRSYIAHVDHHRSFADKKRAAMGLPPVRRP